MTKKKSIIVTGGMGFIGSHLVDALLKKKRNVIVVDNLSTGNLKNLEHHKKNKKLKFYKRSINEDLSFIFKKYKITEVYHVAAIPRVLLSIAEPLLTNKTNIDGTLNLLELCKKYGVKRFIFSSSSSVYGDQRVMPLNEEMALSPLSPYALQKLTCEHYCALYNLNHGMETICLRYFNVFGPRQDPEGEYAGLIPKMIGKIKKGEAPVIFNDGEQRRDWTSVFDVVKANILAGSTKDKKCFAAVFNIGAGDNHSVNEVVDALLLAYGSDLKKIPGRKVIEPFETCADISLANKFLKWKPTEDFYYRLQELL